MLPFPSVSPFAVVKLGGSFIRHEVAELSVKGCRPVRQRCMHHAPRLRRLGPCTPAAPSGAAAAGQAGGTPPQPLQAGLFLSLTPETPPPPGRCPSRERGLGSSGIPSSPSLSLPFPRAAAAAGWQHVPAEGPAGPAASSLPQPEAGSRGKEPERQKLVLPSAKALLKGRAKI